MRRHPLHEHAGVLVVKRSHKHRPNARANAARGRGPTGALAQSTDVLETVRDVGDERRSNASCHQERPRLSSWHGLNPRRRGTEGRRQYHYFRATVVRASLPLPTVALDDDEAPTEPAEAERRPIQQRCIWINRPLNRHIGRLHMPFPRTIDAGRGNLHAWHREQCSGPG